MRAVSYLRVSTIRQNQSGLGLEAQRAAVAVFLKSGAATHFKEFVEVESGTRADRPVLAQAIGYARAMRATLVIARLDRLARNVGFLANLMDAGIDFVAADMPHANRLTIHVLAAVAEAEAKAISERTKAALAAAKARGVVLGGKRAGTPPPPARLGAEARRRTAAEHAADLAVVFDQYAGLSHGRLAALLQLDGVPTAQGGAWSATQVSRTRKRLAATDRALTSSC